MSYQVCRFRCSGGRVPSGTIMETCDGWVPVLDMEDRPAVRMDTENSLKEAKNAVWGRVQSYGCHAIEYIDVVDETAGQPPDSKDVSANGTAALGYKDSAGKPRWMLLPFKALEPVVRVLEFGASKYAEGSWAYVEDAETKYADALVRHFVAWQSGHRIDPESGLSHLAHLVCDGIFLLAFELGMGKTK